MKSNGRPRPPGFYRFESFGHDDLTAKHCYFRCSRPPDVDRIKIFGKDDQAAKHQGLLVLIGLKVLVMMTSLQNIVISGAQGLLMLMGSKFLIKMTRPQNIKSKRTMFCGLVIFIKNFDPINIRRP